jgi:hypothetical protein
MADWKVTITGTFTDSISLTADSKKQAMEDALDAFDAFYDVRMTEFDTPQDWDTLQVVRVKKDR